MTSNSPKVSECWDRDGQESARNSNVYYRSEIRKLAPHSSAGDQLYQGAEEDGSGDVAAGGVDRVFSSPVSSRCCNLAALRILENEAKVQDEAVMAAQSSLDLSNQRYSGGVTSYLEVTIAQSAALADEVTAVNILGRRMADTVLLIEALGGGWDRSSLPDRPECCGKLASSADTGNVNTVSPR
jgi:hypothetical protein